MKRRTFLASAATLAGAAALAPPRLALADPSRIVVGTWGGAGAETLRKVVDGPLSAARGVEIIQDIGNGEARLTKLLVGRQSSRGTFDVAHLSDADHHVASLQNVLQQIDTASVPRSALVLQKLHSPDSIPFVYTVQAIIYNRDRVTEPPKSYADLWSPRWKDKIGFADQFHNQVITAAALAAGGSVSDFSAAPDKLRELKKLGARVYPSHEAIAAALNSGEIDVTISLASRAVFWARSGVPVGFALPSEGSTLLVYRAMVPLNARNAAGAWLYLDAMLTPEAQLGLAQTMACMPVVSDVELPPELAQFLPISAKDFDRFLLPDFAYLTSVRDRNLTFWQREFRA
ncbi:MAG: extracellular solute-binding protein [Chelatococcus sp.]|uniref:extracellular solute-binding protein n=1 Tax=Chelatococcus sp. TaxID=1953771 RepID=UPI0025C3E34A|nr:extracellular solute-binding protein [Chelatococcus sp.]MBX3540353.1 extracellular solute-binding protein [Chelatococcus sp.]